MERRDQYSQKTTDQKIVMPHNARTTPAFTQTTGTVECASAEAHTNDTESSSIPVDETPVRAATPIVIMDVEPRDRPTEAETESSQRAKAKARVMAILAAFGESLSMPEDVDGCWEVNVPDDTARGNFDDEEPLVRGSMAVDVIALSKKKKWPTAAADATTAFYPAREFENVVVVVVPPLGCLEEERNVGRRTDVAC